MVERGREPAWADSPSNSNGGLAKILTIRPGGGEKVICLSSRLVGVFVHFVDGRTTPCTEQPPKGKHPGSRCHVDHLRTSTRWQGWLAVQLQKCPLPFMLSITEAVVRDAKSLLVMSGNLRGLRMLLFRSNSSPRSKLCCQLFEGASAWEGGLLPEPDVREFLFRLWGMQPSEGYSDDALLAADVVTADQLDRAHSQGQTVHYSPELGKLLRSTLRRVEE